MNWKILKTWLQEEKLKAGICHRGHVPCQAGQVVNPRGHNHLSSQAFTMAGRWDSFSASLGGTIYPFRHTSVPFRHFSLRQRWFYFLLLWVTRRTRSESDGGWKKYLSISLQSAFITMGPFSRYRDNVCPWGFIRR